FDAPAQRPAERAQQRYRREERRDNDPVYRERVDDDEDDADEGGEDQVDRERNELLDVGSDLLKLAQRLAASLILEDGVGQLQRVPDTVRVHLGADPLDDDVD